MIPKALKMKLEDPNYPCTPALMSLKLNQLIYVSLNKELSVVQDLSHHLDAYISRYDDKKEPYLSLWLSFDRELHNEVEFEKFMFAQIAAFRSGDQYFRGKHRLFIVGMHPNSPRRARNYETNSIVINLFDQFETIKNYKLLVDSIRERDAKYSGSVNPMTIEYGDTNEEIQFSGKLNDSWIIP